MKKSILTLMILLVCAIQTTTAYEYFTIYFSDGTKSEAFYATDVDSICYSKLSLDGIAYDDWQVQEIYTCDSIYRYSLAQIDSLSFKDMDDNKIAERIAQVIVKTDSLLGTIDNIEVLKSELPKIRQIEEVEDAYINNQTLFVDIKDWGCINYYFPLAEKGENMNSISRQIATSRHSQSIKVHDHSHPLSACIVNQQQRDEGRAWFGSIAGNVHHAFVNMGIRCEIINMPGPHFFNNEIFSYDLVFLKTHGYYDTKYGLHWLFTGEELLCHDAKITSFDSTYVKIKQIFKNHTYSPLKMTFSRVDEIRNGNKTHVYYTVISEEFIRASKRKFKNEGSAIVFNTACESMMGNIVNFNNMAKAFLNRGAGSYLGYDDSNNIGAYGGSSFFFYLLNGLSTSDSYNILPDWCKEQNMFLYYDNDGDLKTDYKKEPGRNYVKQYHPYLLVEPEGQSLCITHPETIEINDNFGIGGAIKLQGKMGLLKSLKIDDGVSFSYDNHTFGFQYSPNSDMSQAKAIDAEGNYDSSTLYMTWEKTLDDNDLQPNTTYYYRAYMNDGYSDCYGEIKSFTTKENGTGGEDTNDCIVYYIDNGDSTITIYYDNREIYMRYDIINDNFRAWPWVKKVTFDSSFSNYYPQSTAEWFSNCRNLQSIDNICYLNTSKVKSMRGMFYGCRSLTSLDLSHFNTSNVEYMDAMFCDCGSLININLDNFNTSKVKGMRDMFSGCSSLKSINLTSFNTSNVEAMEYMFGGCSSLTDLDLSSFNTSKVKEMYGMFAGCINLTNLDFRNLYLIGDNGSELFWHLTALETINLCNANTTNATNMSNMFSGCSSLKSIDLSSFNTSNVESLSDMFENCCSLTILDLSSFNTEKACHYRGWNGWGISFMFSGCSSLKTIYAGDWDNIGEYGCFSGCSSLVGGKGTKIGKNLYGYDKNGNPLYYYCSEWSKAAHIDGGKDNPGLFTAK